MNYLPLYLNENMYTSETITIYIGTDEQYFKIKIAIIFLAISLKLHTL